MFITATNRVRNRNNHSTALKWVAFFVLLLVACISIGNYSHAYAQGQQATATIQGQVTGIPAGETVAAVSLSSQHSATVAADGTFAFENLPAGDYTIYIPLANGYALQTNSEWQVSQQGDMLWLTVSVAASGKLALPSVTLTEAQNAALKIAAFFDSNENGTRGPYERPITGVTVEAVPGEDGTAEAVASATTDALGETTLANMAPGTYVLRFTLPAGYLYTVENPEWGIGNSSIGGVQSLTAVSRPIVLAAGQTAEAGVGAIPVGSFSGRVWNDLNNNGVMDADEPGAANIKLTMTGAKTGHTYEVTTDETGTYTFALLRNDTYNFTAQIPDNALFARYTQTGGDSRSVFTTEGTTATRQFLVTDAQNVVNKNVGIVEKGVITGIAFLDHNYNGKYDEGEPTYAGVTLEVIKVSNSKSMGKAVTGEDGVFTFDALRGGDYSLRAILPADGSIFTIVPQGVDGLYNQFAAREGRRENTVNPLTLANGTKVETLVGVAMGGTIKGTVFLDAKYNGALNDSDKKVSGVKVQLVDAAGVLVDTDTTNANGNYTLEGIMPGDYMLRFQRKDGHAFTRYRPTEQDGNHVQRLDKDGFGETETVTVAMGQVIERMNAGMLPSSTLTGVFFDDLNDNGLQDAGEAGFVSGSVRLLSEDKEIDLTETVGEDGTYFFDGVMPGTYTVTYIVPENATIARVAEGGNTLEAQGQQTVLAGLVVEAGKAYAAPLVGAVTLGTFQGYAYHDANGNNTMDANEKNLGSVEVTLKPDRTDLDAVTVTTGNDGRFAIADLRPANYTITLTLPNGYIFSGDVVESGLVLRTENTDTLSCPWNSLINRKQNAIGAVKPATINASVWLDENRDGKQADTETLLGGLKYELYDEVQSKIVKTATSAEDGYVTFENVRPSTYTVRFEIPEQAEPADDTASTFVQQGSRMLHSGIVIGESETFDDISGGMVSYTSIGGVVALDENGTRTPQAGIPVALYQADGRTPLQNATTDESGTYRFDGLWPDEYRIEAQLPSGMIFVRPADPNYTQGASVIATTQDATGISDAFTLQMAQHLLAQNIILIKPARVGDQVWLDNNGNGLIDADEPTINGVTIQLVQDGEVAYTTQSNEWGYYEFRDVYPGAYTIVAQAYAELGITKAVPSLMIISSCLTSGDGESASSDEFSVASGSRNFDFNLGYVLLEGKALPQSITPGSGQVWTK